VLKLQLLREFPLLLCSLGGTQALVDDPLVFDPGLSLLSPKLLILNFGVSFRVLQFLAKAPGLLGGVVFRATHGMEL